MPKLWTDTVEEHRRAVRDATLDATAKLVAAHGLSAVTMSKIAAETGIGRATLYKYFPDLESVLVAWHERQVGRHLEQLARIQAGRGDPGRRLQAVLSSYAGLTRTSPHDTGLSALLHRGDHILQAHQHLASLLTGLLAEAAGSGDVRTDVPPGELADYCLHALAAARRLPSDEAVRRLVAVTLDGLRRPADPAGAAGAGAAGAGAAGAGAAGAGAAGAGAAGASGLPLAVVAEPFGINGAELQVTGA